MSVETFSSNWRFAKACLTPSAALPFPYGFALMFILAPRAIATASRSDVNSGYRKGLSWSRLANMSATQQHTRSIENAVLPRLYCLAIEPRHRMLHSKSLVCSRWRPEPRFENFDKRFRLRPSSKRDSAETRARQICRQYLPQYPARESRRRRGCIQQTHQDHSLGDNNFVIVVRHFRASLDRDNARVLPPRADCLGDSTDSHKKNATVADTD